MAIEDHSRENGVHKKPLFPEKFSAQIQKRENAGAIQIIKAIRLINRGESEKRKILSLFKNLSHFKEK